MSSSLHTDWEMASADPDPRKDLGYQSDDWDVITTEQQGTKHLVFLPTDTEEIHRESFIITTHHSVCELVDMR